MGSLLLVAWATGPTMALRHAAAGELSSFSVSGWVTLTGRFDHSGVTITFTRLSGTGAVPQPVVTGTTGYWSVSGFESGTTYLATPSRQGATFTPAWREFSESSFHIDFAGDLFVASGRVTERRYSTDWGVSEVVITFTRLSGTGAIPSPVQTDHYGRWWADGVEPGSAYAATPSSTRAVGRRWP